MQKIAKERKKNIKYIKNNKRGITLVALVVTIIVLLILAGVTITSLLGDDGIIAKAQRAADLTNAAIQQEQEGINALLEELNSYIDGNGGSSTNPGEDETTIPEELERYILGEDKTGVLATDIFDMLTMKFKDNEIIPDASTSLTFLYSENVGDKIHLIFVYKNEAYIGIGSSSTYMTEELLKKPEEETSEIEKWDGKSNSKVTAVESKDNVTVPVPIGFTASTVEGEESVATGFVIKQGPDGSATSGINEFVWVPVEDPSTMFGTNVYGNSLGKLYDFGTSSSPKNPPETYNWTEQYGVMWNTLPGNYREPDIVTQYDGNDATSDSSYFTSAIGNITGEEFKEQLQQEFEEMRKSVETYGGFYIGRYETGGLSGTAVVQKNNTDINNQNWYVMYSKSKTIAQGTQATSSMIWGCQWDATLRWFLESNDENVRSYVTNGTGKGNYNGTNGNALIPTGSVDEYAVNNIYDMAGNVMDRTLEANHTGFRVNRRRLLQRFRFRQCSF